MRSFLSCLDGLDRRISETAVLPPKEQEEALVALFQATERSELTSFVGLLIGEVVALRETTRSRLPRPSPAPALAAS